MSPNLIKKISFIFNDVIENIDFKSENHLITILTKFGKGCTSFDVKIEFSSSIKKVRLPSYTWGILEKETIIPEYSNKILQLENGTYIQSESPIGIWQFCAKQPKILFWKFNPKGAYQFTEYRGTDNYKCTENIGIEFPKNFSLKLIFSQNGALEISRSKIPFSSIICFTDHCDFDTLDLLEKQRVFFKEKNIKITKGFFLKHFSKREDNASWENDSNELKNWINDDHELCYHSLSQSIKPRDESFQDFKNFVPPSYIPTWIDHGYQPYNISLFKKEGFSETEYADTLQKKNIKILWNYIDSGTATNMVLNQLNCNEFTLKSFCRGIKNKPIKTRISMLIKNCIVHFYNNEKLTRNYTQLASSFKKVSKTKSVKDFLKFIKSCFRVIVPLIKIALYWSKTKHRVYRSAKYSPVFFEHQISNQKFIVFQTIELLDFKNTFEKKSIDKFVSDKGLCIAHTYFGVPLSYHDGRLFTNENEINPQVNYNFDYLSSKIENKEIWNPTLVEFVNHWEKFKNTTVSYDYINNKAQIINPKLPCRIIY